MWLILFVLPQLTGESLKAPRQLNWLLGVAPWAVGGQLVTFALWGYGPASIAFSAVNEGVWFCFAYVFWVNVRGRPVREWPAALWLVGVAVVMLLVSTLGTAALILFRVVLQTGDPVLHNLGVYLFLQPYGDGWLEVGFMGVAAALLGGLPSRDLARWQSWLVLVLMVPSTLRLLAPFGLVPALAWLGALAGVGMAVAQVLFLVNIAPAVSRIPARVVRWWYMAGAALALKAVLELLPLLPGWAALAMERNLVIAFLHLKLVALVSAGLIGALGYLREPGRGYWLYGSGSAVMIGALAVAGFFPDAGYPALHGLYRVAFAAGTVAALGGAGAVWPMAGPVWRAPLSNRSAS